MKKTPCFLSQFVAAGAAPPALTLPELEKGRFFSDSIYAVLPKALVRVYSGQQIVVIIIMIIIGR
jgi:hypothetical protein